MERNKMEKLIYLTTNPNKVNEANEKKKKKYGFNIEIVNPDFEMRDQNIVLLSVNQARKQLYFLVEELEQLHMKQEEQEDVGMIGFIYLMVKLKL